MNVENKKMSPWHSIVGLHSRIRIGGACASDVWQSDVYWGSRPCFWHLLPRYSKISVELVYFLDSGSACPWLWMLLVS